MIALIRIHGMIKVPSAVQETMHRLRLRKKYTCVVVDEKPETVGMITKVKDFIAFGKIDEKTLTEIIKARGKVLGDTKAKIKDAEKIAKEVFAGKTLEELKVKPFFGLHPARGGIDTKHHYPKGVLGDHKENISKLIMRML
jgi:large subunit ribosomal protein L30